MFIGFDPTPLQNDELLSGRTQAKLQEKVPVSIGGLVSHGGSGKRAEEVVAEGEGSCTRGIVPVSNRHSIFTREKSTIKSSWRNSKERSFLPSVVLPPNIYQLRSTKRNHANDGLARSTYR
jgi:hypothetical protein